MNKEEIIKYIKEKNRVTFAELEDAFPDMIEPSREEKDAISWCLPDHENLVMWHGWKKDAFEILCGALRDHELEIQPASPLDYETFLELPIATEIKQYKTPHWLPLVLNAAGTCNCEHHQAFNKLRKNLH